MTLHIFTFELASHASRMDLACIEEKHGNKERVCAMVVNFRIFFLRPYFFSSGNHLVY
uniref:Uncharacterized protein n=1 Tax=Rhizophora mucronata TaxID=61149 RepID=A0A2P2Q9H6_RHIMU